MLEERDHYVLVPDEESSALLVVASSRGTSLPRTRGRRGAAGVLEAVRDAYGLDATYLRTARMLRDDSGRPVGALHALDAPPQGWDPPRGSTWLALDLAEPAALAPDVLAPDVERWLAEQRGATVPEARSPWARPGWFREAARLWFHTEPARWLRGAFDLVEAV
jgi:hypothetical protein